MWQSLNGQHISLTALPLNILLPCLALLPYTKLQVYNKTPSYWFVGKQLFFFSQGTSVSQDFNCFCQGQWLSVQYFSGSMIQILLLVWNTINFNRATVYKPLPIISFNNIRYNLSLKFVFMFAAPMPQLGEWGHPMWKGHGCSSENWIIYLTPRGDQFGCDLET